MMLPNTLGRVHSFIHSNGSNILGLYITFFYSLLFASEFGSVKDVRIPCQPEQRMFGFVTFSNSETVDEILSMCIQHFVGETEVLVKPYQELPNRLD